MTRPIDGYGLYESTFPDSGSSVWQPILQKIAAGGFGLVLNQNLLHGHITDIIAYINYAYSLSLKVIVDLHSPTIWRDGTYPTVLPQLYADSGNAATGILFMQYIVAQTKSLPGVWGWYVCDEIANADHAVWQPYAAAVQTADSIHPRLAIADCFSVNGVGTGTNLFYDGCDVWGDDCYPIGHIPTIDVGIEAAHIQTQANLRGVQSAIVLQAHNLADYGSPTGTWPTQTQMQQNFNSAIANMTPRLILWFIYSEAVSPSAPPSHWNDLISVFKLPPLGPSVLSWWTRYPVGRKH